MAGSRRLAAPSRLRFGPAHRCGSGPSGRLTFLQRQRRFNGQTEHRKGLYFPAATGGSKCQSKCQSQQQHVRVQHEPMLILKSSAEPRPDLRTECSSEHLNSLHSEAQTESQTERLRLRDSCEQRHTANRSDLHRLCRPSQVQEVTLLDLEVSHEPKSLQEELVLLRLT